MTVTNMATGAQHIVPYTPYPDLIIGELFIRLPNRLPATLAQLEGRFDEAAGRFYFPDSYPKAMTRHGFPVFRRRDVGGDERLEIEDEE